ASAVRVFLVGQAESRHSLDAPGPLDTMKPARLPAFLAAGVLCACGPAADGAAGDPARDADSMAEAAELAAREACGDAATISGNGVGTLTLGMSVSAARDACDMRDTTFTLGEGLMESGLTTSLAAGGAIVALTTDSDSVLRLMVTGAGPATEQGIGVGSSIASVREAYPDACVMSGEGRLVAI